ncbi:MAG: glycosyltransferase [Chloroflexota bacterium]|nr:glycosyltransferase [Chloroflexota bacterium]
MRVCIVYDCLFPWTVGGAERWYRALSERLAADGHRVTYLTLQQWEARESPRIPNVRVVAVGPRLALYAKGRRRLLPPLVFGAGVFRHLARHGRDYDIVHLASFPYFSFLAAAALRPRGRYHVVVDWHEVWTRRYWQEYLGPVLGPCGWLVQRLCLRIPHRPCCFSRLTHGRLRAEGCRQEPVLLRLLPSVPEPTTPDPAVPVVVYAGRHIPEKRVPALIPALALARRALPELQAVIFGDGPDRPLVERLVVDAHLQDAVRLPGFVDRPVLEGVLRRALCLVVPSCREGYGLVVVEAAGWGVPSIVVRGRDNAVTELIEEGVNGFVAPSPAAPDLATAIRRVHDDGWILRESTAAWFGRFRSECSPNVGGNALASIYGDGADRLGPGLAGLAFVLRLDDEVD